MTALRLAIDTGGTFTDLVVERPDVGLRMYKAPTTPADPVNGILSAIDLAAADLSHSRRDLLGDAEMLIFGTTRATNAIVTGHAARTALLITQGHRDTLLFREGGGRALPFKHAQPYPEPYVPRSLTFEVPERITADGSILTPLDEERLAEIVRDLPAHGVEAVAVCLLWSIVNPVHEERVGAVLAAELPDIPYTLSHQLNPSLREYRRASSAAIDASLKPMMSAFYESLETTLRADGFAGRLLAMTAEGGVLDVSAVAATPIRSIGSGPAAAPVAARAYARADAGTDTAIVTDAGGTTFDVSLVRNGTIPWARDAMVVDPITGYITGFPAVEVTSVGAGGGSIAWIDDGGLLHVGPDSAGAVPGPACYDAGGDRPTVTDACVVLGYIDPEYFLGGAIRLDADRAREVVTRDIAAPLGMTAEAAAAAIVDLAIERMVQAIEEITLTQGIDPAQAVMVGGGGGAGLYAAGIARRLGCTRVVIPPVSAALSAMGELLSDLQRDFQAAGFTTTAAFDFELAEATVARLRDQGAAFAREVGLDEDAVEYRFSVEARYPNQVWEVEVPLATPSFADDGDVEAFRQAFHAAHRELFAVMDPSSSVELLQWRLRVRGTLRQADERLPVPALASSAGRPASRRVYFDGPGFVEATVVAFDGLAPGHPVAGPAIVESPVTSIVIDADAEVERLESGSLIINIGSVRDAATAPAIQEVQL